MSDKIKEALKISDILSNDIYIIPIYQRNYEWESEQISRLIEDINGIGENEKYYLGTLVTFLRKDEKYELIDGQQRHTTLNLLKAFLSKNIDNFNLEFQARTECSIFFNQIKKEKSIDNLYENEKSSTLNRGLEIISNVFADKNINKEEFSKKLFEQTYIFRTELPPYTDLNHYFEIMNNRGEQLEKHEILKAQLMGTLENPAKEIAFAKIWDACADMGDYVWNNIDISKKFQEMTTEQIITDKNETLFTDVLNTYSIPENFSQENQEKSAIYRSVIDFPTFLLYAYSIFENKEISFDDKKLLEIFKDYTKAEEFIQWLFELRIFFDKYVIKQSTSITDKEPTWGIRDFDTTTNSAKENVFDNSEYENKIEMLQSMFYYSGISDNRKDWLLKILKYHDQEITDTQLFEILKDHFYSLIKDIDVKELKYPEVSIKTFYYFEWMLWEMYYDHFRGENNKGESLPENLKFITKVEKQYYANFKFRQLNSKEHLLAQEIAGSKKCDDNSLHCFGNLCLISNSDNSSSNNHSPDVKKDRLQNNNASLKRLIMFKTFEGNEWNLAQIQRHQNDMEKLLNFYKQRN